MIYKYTDAELKELKEFEAEHNEKSRKIQLEMQNHKEGSKGYNKLNEQLAAVMDDFFRGYDKLDAKFEKAHFDALGNDPQTILDNGKEQIPLIIEENYEGRKKYDLIFDDNGDMKPRSDNPKIEMAAAIELLNRELHLHFDALSLIEDNSYYSDLRDAIYKYLATSPYIEKTGGKEPGQTDSTLITRPAPPIIKTAGLLNDKTTRAIVSGNMLTQDLSGQIQMFISTNEAPSNAEKQVVNTIAMRYEGDDIRIAKRLTAFDTAVYNAVSTLYFYQGKGNHNTPVYLTPQEVWRTMNGIKDSRKNPTAKQLANVTKSLDKMRFTNFYMDISQEINANYITLNDERLTNGHIETYLLKAEKVSFKTEKGKEIAGYRIDNEPILYTYNAAKDHVIFVDYDLLDTSDKTGNEGYTVEFRTYLLQQIELMKNGIRNSTRILYSTIYADTAIPAPAERVSRKDYSTDNAYQTGIKKEAQADRKKINALLDSWIDKGYIQSYSPAKKGRSYIGVNIKPIYKPKAIDDGK